MPAMRCPACENGDLQPLVDRADGQAACDDGRCAMRCAACGHVAITADPVAVAMRNRRIRVLTVAVSGLALCVELVANSILPWVVQNKNPGIHRFLIHTALGGSLLCFVYMAAGAVLASMTASSFKERNEHAAAAIFWVLALCGIGYVMFRGVVEGRL